MVKQLADYIERNSPGVKGFSDKNLWRMKQFYETYKDADEKLSAVLRQISWTKSPSSRCKYWQTANVSSGSPLGGERKEKKVSINNNQ